MPATTTLIAYDIADPARLRRVFQLCKAFGDHLQYSLFCADLTPTARAEFIAALTPLMHQHEDRVLLVRLGATTSDTRARFTSLGRQDLPDLGRGDMIF